MDTGNREAAADQQPSREQIARRAHEISEGPDSGTDEENWLRAEEELTSSMEANPTAKPRKKREAAAEPITR
jgi:hypothetical protein